MTLRGAGFDAGPSACPFVALELDRDRRSERPDYRHRCYAEQVPAPRTIAHQERYCLSPNFAGCPIFQDWAVRAAARPVPLPPGYEGRRAAPDPRQGHEAAAAAAAAAGASQEWPDSMASNVPVEQSAAVDAPPAQEQLSVFDAPQSPTPPLPPPDEPSPLIEAAPIAAAASIAPDEPDDGDQLPPLAAADVLPPLAAAPVGIPIEPEPTDAIPPLPDAAPPRAPDVDEAAVPAFLAGRSSRPPRPPDAAAPVPRDDVVPSWELTDRYGAQGGGESDGNGMFSKVFTIIAVVLILALGVAAVVLIPGLLGGSPQATPRPSLLAGASRSPLITQAASGALATPTTAVTAPPSVEPTAQSTPAPTPRSYRIKPGDTLAKISRRFNVPVADILAANPQISDASHIEVGQFIIIPLGVPPTAP